MKPQKDGKGKLDTEHDRYVIYQLTVTVVRAVIIHSCVYIQYYTP